MMQITYKKGIYTLLALCLLNAPALAQGYKVNRDEEGIRNCDTQLAECQQILHYYARQNARITNEEELTFPASGGTQILPIKSRQAWSFTGSHDWCSAQKEDDGLAISVEPNPTPVRRSQTVTLKWKNGQQLVKITQDRSELQFSVSENDIYFTADDQEKRVEVSANVDWTVDQSTIPEWCNLRTDKDAVYLTLTPNNTAEQRRAAITLHAETKKEIIRIEGVREHNLQNLSLSIPRGEFTVVTGVSGSGKSSLVRKGSLCKSSTD